MTGVLWFLLLGLPAAALLDRSMTAARLPGTGLLLGPGIVALLLLVMPSWTYGTVLAACILLTIGIWWLAWWRARKEPPRTEVAAKPVSWPARIVDLLTLALIVAHSIMATAARVGVWDFWAIWGLKARVFFERGAIDWAFLAHPRHAFAHPDYPPLLPLDYVFLAIQHRGWNDEQLGLLTTLFAAGLVLLVRQCFAEELPPLMAALATFGLASIALTQWIGTAEAPMIAYASAALLMLRRGSLTLGAVFLGFAALTKNEGLALFAAIAIAMVITGRRKDVLRLWPAAAIAAPWFVLRTVHGLHSELASGSVFERASNQFGEVVRLLVSTPLERPLLWVAVLASLAVFVTTLKNEKFVLTAVLLQVLFYLAVYVGTPYELRWHFTSSWPRLLDHVAVPLGFTALLATGRFFATAGGILWTAVGDGGTNSGIEHRKPWN